MIRLNTLMKGAYAVSALALLPSVLSADAPTNLTGWGFTSDGGFTMSEPVPGTVSLTATSPSTGSGASQVSFRTQFDRIVLTPGDSLTLTGTLEISSSIPDGNAYLGWSWARMGLFDSHDNAGTLASNTWSETDNTGFSGYLLVLPTSSSGANIGWGAGESGAAGGMLKGNTTAWYSQDGGAGLGGAAQSPDTAGIGPGAHNFELRVTRLGSYLTKFDYLFRSTGTDTYILQDTVYDRGVNSDGTPAALAFDSMGFSTSSSSFTDMVLSDVQVTYLSGPSTDPNSLYDFETTDGLDDWFACPAAERVRRTTLSGGTINDLGALAITMPDGFINWGAQLSVPSYSDIYQAIRAAKEASVDLVRYAIRFDVTLLSTNSGGYTGEVNAFAALQSGSHIKQWGTGESEPLTMTWDSDKTGTFTADLSLCEMDMSAATLNFYIGLQADTASAYTVLIDNVRLAELEPTTELRQEVAHKYLNTNVDADGYACPDGMGWAWVSEYPFIYSYDLDAWREPTSEYTFGWLWMSGNFNTGTWFWDYYTEKWFYSDRASWPWAYFHEDDQWVYLADGGFAIVRSYEQTPDALVLNDGVTEVTTANWETRRSEIKELFMEHMYGHIFEEPEIEILSETEWTDNTYYGVKSKVLTVQMTVGENSVTTSMYVDLPLTASEENPMPVIMTKEDLFNWGGTLYDMSQSSRKPYTDLGWAGAGINFTDFAPDSTDARTGLYYDLYGEDADTGALMVWAWCYSRLIDVLEMKAFPEIDLTKIGVTGHSRYGKCSLLAGAFDERITLTAPSHSGSGGTGSFMNWFAGAEPINASAGGSGFWYCPNFQNYKDAPQTLPVDTHLLTCLVAPRGLIQIEGTNDSGTGPKAVQLSYMAAARVYKALGAENMLGIRFRPVGHVGNDGDVISFANFLWFEGTLDEGFNFLPYPIEPEPVVPMFD